MRKVLSKYRDVARLSFGRIPAGPQTALLSEWLFTLLQPVGIPDRAIAYIGDIAGLYVGAYCFEESLGYASPTGEELPPEQIVQMMRDYMLSLPRERFPRTHRRARPPLRVQPRGAVRVRPRPADRWPRELCHQSFEPPQNS